MVLLATALTRQFFDASLPAALIALGRDDPAVESMAARILALWRADEPAGPPSYKTLSMDRLRLHDGFRRRTNYVARTLFLPTPQHVEMIALPRALGFAYVPLKLAHDFIALPPWRAYKMASAQTGRMRKAFANSSLGVALTPKARETAQSAKFHHRERANIQRAIARTPDKAANWRNYATEMLSAGRQGDALSYVDKALALDPRDSRAWAIRARALSEAMRYGEAVVASDTALALDPANIAARRIGIHAQLFACDWRRRDENDRQIVQSIERGERVITPFNHRALSNSESEGLALARVWSKQFPAAATPLWRGERYTHDKIRVAYVSTDFRDHVVTVAIAGCFERHDRTKFEVTAISLGPNDGSEMRGRLEAVFDRFIDAETLGDHAVAQTLRELEIDVAVDLNGYSGDKRTGIFAHRAAPVQVNYLGYPGTMGLPYFDYVVADRVAIPPENQSCYSEKVVYLPDTFIPTDRTRPIADVTTSRVEAGLPETGFVFACHNTSYKIGPRIFDIWMRLLTAVEGSVLWLASANASAIVNLRREAQSRGVDPERLVFATRVPRREDHLARLRLADLFLDTTPYNAHSTAADALWAGLPLLTYLGSTFPARVAASLLYAIDLPELVTATLEEYEQRALALALDRDMLASIRAKLLRNRLSTPLFDTIRYTRNLEAAFGIMVERQRAGFAPESFAVER
jgi:predicted O-linked N-acetylglucosamine transferase (SPINDLY family)